MKKTRTLQLNNSWNLKISTRVVEVRLVQFLYCVEELEKTLKNNSKQVALMNLDDFFGKKQLGVYRAHPLIGDYYSMEELRKILVSDHDYPRKTYYCFRMRFGKIEKSKLPAKDKVRDYDNLNNKILTAMHDIRNLDGLLRKRIGASKDSIPAK